MSVPPLHTPPVEAACTPACPRVINCAWWCFLRLVRSLCSTVPGWWAQTQQRKWSQQWSDGAQALFHTCNCPWLIKEKSGTWWRTTALLCSRQEQIPQQLVWAAAQRGGELNSVSLWVWGGSETLLKGQVYGGNSSRISLLLWARCCFPVMKYRV